MLSVSELTILSGGSTHQMQHARAMKTGLQAHGVRASIQSPTVKALTKHVACWGWRYGQVARSQGKEVLVMERGYIGDRFKWTSLGWNGLNGRATFYPKDDPDRFQANFADLMKPWRETGDYVLLIGQVPGDASLAGQNLSGWYQASAAEAFRSYRLPVRFRPHPMALARGHRQSVRGVELSKATLDQDFAGAAVVVSFNSNTTVESVLAGIPTIALDEGSMAYEMCGRAIGATWKPQRERWAARLAWCQWTMDEIESGAAWEAIKPQ